MLGDYGAVSGIIFNLVRAKLPTVPQVLKSGGLSKAKSIDTDVDTYLQAIKDNRLNPNDYVDILNHLKENSNRSSRDTEFIVHQRSLRTSKVNCMKCLET